MHVVSRQCAILLQIAQLSSKTHNALPPSPYNHAAYPCSFLSSSYLVSRKYQYKAASTALRLRYHSVREPEDVIVTLLLLSESPQYSPLVVQVVVYQASPRVRCHPRRRGNQSRRLLRRRKGS